MSTYHSNKLSLISPLMGWCNIRMSHLLCKELWSASCMKKSNFSAGAEWLLLLLLGVVCANIYINLYNICIYNKHQHSPILYPKCNSITSTIKKNHSHKNVCSQSFTFRFTYIPALSIKDAFKSFKHECNFAFKFENAIETELIASHHSL